VTDFQNEMPPPLPPRKPSGGVVALGIINIVYSALFYSCCGLGSIFTSFLGPVFQKFAEEQELTGFESAGPLQAYNIINGIVIIGLGILLIIGGIGLLRLRPWGRSLSISTAVALIIWILIAFAINLFFLFPTQSRMVSDQFTPEQQMIFLVIAGIVAVFFQLIYPVVLLVCLNLRSIKLQFEEERSQG